MQTISKSVSFNGTSLISFKSQLSIEYSVENEKKRQIRKKISIFVYFIKNLLSLIY